MKNKKNFRWLVGGALAVTFSIQFLWVGLTVKAELLDKQIPSAYTYKTDTLKNLRQIDLGSFLGKPVRIPFASENPDGVPGGDQDLAIVFPPRILDKNASVPLRAMFFSSGKTISAENAEFANKLEKLVSSVGDNNPLMLEVIKNIIQSNLQMSLNTDNCGSLACYVPALLKLARAEETTDSSVSGESTGTNTLLTQDDLGQIMSSLGDMDTSNPQVKQLLTLVLLLIMNNNTMGDSLNSDKQDCLDMGGEWVNGACQSEKKKACEDNGGTYKKLLNSCVKEKLTCGNEDLDCSKEQELDDNDNPLTIYGCACKSGSCLDEDGNCIDQNNTKKKACQKSGGTWKQFSDPVALCQQKCDSTEASCANATFPGSSSKARMDCDCSSATGNDNSSKWAQGTTTQPKMCLSAKGDCIAKDTSKDDDDKDGVPNGKDKCPNSTPDGSGTVNMQEGGQYQGCTCSQIQAMGGLQRQQQQQQCPPDGCEPGSPYMVMYDRSQQNNQQQQNPTCQNGIVNQPQQQQMQVQQYGGITGTYTGTYGACPVMARQWTQQCQDQLDRQNNNNDNMNKKLDDLLKQLKDQNKKQQDQNKGNQGNQGNPNQGNQQQQQQEQKKREEEQKKLGLSAAIDPKGPGEYNAKQDGTNGKPYALHASQFKKVCDANTYVLVSAKPGGGDFKNDPKKSGTVTPGNLNLPSINQYINTTSSCPGGTCPNVNLNDEIKKTETVLRNGWSKIDQGQQKAILEVLNNKGLGAIDKLNQLNNVLQKALSDNASKTQQAQQATAQSNGKPAKSMKDIQEPGAYFKVPTCQELAKTHCCVCSCCDKKDEKCGWAIGTKCNQTGDKGSCEGEKCTKAPSQPQCSEEPAKSIKLEWGEDFKQCSDKGGKVLTGQEKCAKYTLSTHNEGACRYDCTGSPKGCEEGSDKCTIIINGKEIQRFTDERWPLLQDISPEQDRAVYLEFQNKKDGSLIQVNSGTQPPQADWIKNLDNKDGQACKCQDKDKSKPNPNPEDIPDGFKHPPEGAGQQQQTGQQIQLPEGVPGPTQNQIDALGGWGPRGGTTLSKEDMDKYATSPDALPGGDHKISLDQQNQLKKDPNNRGVYSGFESYLSEEAKQGKYRQPTWEEFGQYKSYVNYIGDAGVWRTTVENIWNPFPTFNGYKQGKR